MAALGKILRKGTGAGSALDTVKYERVNQDPSDNEEEDDDVIVIYQDGVPCEQHQNGHVKKGNKNHGAAQSVADEAIEMGLIEKASVTKSSSDIEVKVMGKHAALTRTRIACFVLTFILAIGLVFTFVFILPRFKSKRVKVHRFPATAEWDREYEDYGTESMVRLVDIDQDGRLDIIHSLYRAEDAVAVSLTRASAKDYCKRKNEPYPCIGQIVGIRGHDGEELWRLSSHSGIFELNCANIDINLDGKTDCIGTGRLSTIVAFDPRNGTVFWRGDGDVLVDSWNIYNPLVLPDMNNDGVQEILIAHGGDPSYPPTEKERGAGRLILLDGATGEHIGPPGDSMESAYMEMPGDKETYMSPVLHSTKDGSMYVLFGHGGETVEGSLFAISLPDLYKAIVKVKEDKDVPPFPGEYKAWDDVPKDPHFGLIEIYQSPTKGMMVPPVCVDLNKDGVNDIVVVSYDGHMVAFDGENLSDLWRASLSGFESYSTPAPGYFNDDDVLDFMLHVNEGSWPQYTSSQTLVIDGQNGNILWSLNSSRYEMSSDLVARTTNDQHDVFLYRVQGRESHHKADKTQRAKRYARPYQQYDPDYYENQDKDNSNYNDYGGRMPNRKYKPVPKSPYPNPGSLDRPEPSGLRQYGLNKQPYRPDPRMLGRKGYNRYPKLPLDDSSDGDPWHQQSPYHQDDENDENNFDYDVRLAEEADAGDDDTVMGMKMPSCDDDVDEYTTEIFAIDRTALLAPLLIRTTPPIKYHYNVTVEDLNILREASGDTTDLSGSHLGKRETHRVRSRRHGGGSGRKPAQSIAEAPTTTCSMMYLEERTTGALGDVDGDGRLDLIGTQFYVGELTDGNGNFIREKFKTGIFKVNLERDIRSGSVQPKKIQATVSPKMTVDHTSTGMLDIKFHKWKKQPWREYMGSKGDSIYRS